MEQKGQKAYPVDMEVSDKAAFWADGDCMNSPDAPIRLRNGQRLSVHKYDGVFNPYRDIEAIRGKVCVFQYITQGNRYFAVKEVVGIDELANSLRLKYYYPQETIVSLKIDAIEQVFIVDGIAE
jgi:hypothetical protein